MSDTWADLISEKAIIGKREINSDHGHATVWMVVLADGFMLDCGTNKRRAIMLATTINRGGPELFTKAGLATITDAGE